MSETRRSKVPEVEILSGPRRQSKNKKVTAIEVTIKDLHNPVQSEPTADPVQIRDTDAAEWQAARNLEVDIKQALAAGSLSKSTVGELATRWMRTAGAITRDDCTAAAAIAHGSGILRRRGKEGLA